MSTGSPWSTGTARLLFLIVCSSQIQHVLASRVFGWRVRRAQNRRETPTNFEINPVDVDQHGAATNALRGFGRAL